MTVVGWSLQTMGAMAGCCKRNSDLKYTLLLPVLFICEVREPTKLRAARRTGVDAPPPLLMYGVVDTDGFPIEYYRRAVWGFPDPYVPLPLTESLSVETDEGESLAVHSVHTPGHSDDHTCFHVPGASPQLLLLCTFK